MTEQKALTAEKGFNSSFLEIRPESGLNPAKGSERIPLVVNNIAQNLVITGNPGVGKTFLLELATKFIAIEADDEAQIVYSNGRMHEMSLRVASVASQSWAGPTRHSMMLDFLWQKVQERLDHVRDTRETVWTPSSHVPLVLAVIDEAESFFGELKPRQIAEWESLVRVGPDLGIAVWAVAGRSQPNAFGGSRELHSRMTQNEIALRQRSRKAA